MRKLIASFISMRKILAVFLAGILLLVSTACNADSSLQAQKSDYRTPEVYPPKIYDRNPKDLKGGVNNLSDVDPRADMRGTDIKAKQLVKNAERDIIGTNNGRLNAQSPEQLKQNIKQGVREFGDNVKENATDITEGTKRGIDNIKDNVQTAPENLVNRGVETR